MKKILFLLSSILMFNVSVVEKEYNIPRDQIVGANNNTENKTIFPTGVLLPGDIEDEELP